MPVETKGRSCSRRLRLTAANSRIMGAAEGTIIATIMMTHIANMSSWDMPQSALCECCMSHAKYQV